MLLLVEQECDLVLGTLTHQTLVSRRTMRSCFGTFTTMSSVVLRPLVLPCPLSSASVLKNMKMFHKLLWENLEIYIKT